MVFCNHCFFKERNYLLINNLSLLFTNWVLKNYLFLSHMISSVFRTSFACTSSLSCSCLTTRQFLNHCLFFVWMLFLCSALQSVLLWVFEEDSQLCDSLYFQLCSILIITIIIMIIIIIIIIIKNRESLRKPKILKN